MVVAVVAVVINVHVVDVVVCCCCLLFTYLAPSEAREGDAQRTCCVQA